MKLWLVTALILAIPTYGISIVAYFLLSWGKQASAMKLIPNAIKLSVENNEALCFNEIKFPVVLAFAEETSTVTDRMADYFEFEYRLPNDELEYTVRVSREQPTNAAIIKAQAYVFLRVDAFTSSSVPKKDYTYWKNSGISDFHICEYHMRSMIRELNSSAELLNAGMTWEQLCTIPAGEETKLSTQQLLKKYT